MLNRELCVGNFGTRRASINNSLQRPTFNLLCNECKDARGGVVDLVGYGADTLQHGLNTRVEDYGQTSSRAKQREEWW
jgi:hypothetical protein